MSGYRQHRFDPNAYEQPGPPMRPYNWVQWTGVAIGALGLVLIALDLLGRTGLVPRWVDAPSSSFVLLLIGVILVNSRRHPETQVDSEQLGRNRKLLLITVGIVAAVLTAAAAIQFSGV